MIKMLQAYHNDNDDVEFKFIHVFKRIKKCDKWVEVRASLGKRKDATFDPTATLTVARKVHPALGNKKAKLAQDEAPAVERLQSSIEKCIAVVATNNSTREEKYDARWAKMFEKQ
jgi:hypothetical protein